jgi:UDP-N-acetylmuramoyl-tripeptide--D-alanyl-D-alanine ligase
MVPVNQKKQATIQELYSLFLQYPRITTDSRNCPPESIFFAWKGGRFDGNEYAGQALAAGCRYAVIDDPRYDEGEQTVLTDDVLKTLQLLATHHRKAMNLPVIAVTGTNGKTTTKELLAAVLSAGFKILYTEGNLNNSIGVPLTLLRLNRGHEMAVIEMGASHPGDIRELVEIARPDYGIITNAGRAHLEGFGSYGNVLATKGELYDYLRRTPGRIFIKKENEALQSIAQGLEQITYGQEESAFVSGQILRSDPFLTLQWRKQGGEVHTLQTQLIGDYNMDNVLAAVTAGCYFNLPPACINRAIEAYAPSNNRSQLKETANNTVIIDAYNANPDSMKAALHNFASMDRPAKAIILGDMFELGTAGDALHNEIVQYIRQQRFDKVFLCGEHFSAVGKDFPTYPATEELVEALRRQPLKGYHILVKGSRAMALEKVVEFL